MVDSTVGPARLGACERLLLIALLDLLTGGADLVTLFIFDGIEVFAGVLDRGPGVALFPLSVSMMSRYLSPWT